MPKIEMDKDGSKQAPVFPVLANQRGEGKAKALINFRRKRSERIESVSNNHESIEDEQGGDKSGKRRMLSPLQSLTPTENPMLTPSALPPFPLDFAEAD